MPLKASITYTRPSIVPSIHFPSLEKRSPEKGTGVLDSSVTYNMVIFGVRGQEPAHPMGLAYQPGLPDAYAHGIDRLHTKMSRHSAYQQMSEATSSCCDTWAHSLVIFMPKQN